MKTFREIVFDADQARKELAEFKDFLTNNRWLSEKSDIAPFFRTREQLSAAIGFQNPYIGAPDRLAYEFKIEGDFQCDLVIGESSDHQFCFVEFEDACEESIFTTSGRAIPTYSQRLEHGFSQIVDWFCKLRQIHESQTCEDIFGGRTPNYVGLVVIGRECALKDQEKARLRWRRDHTLVNSKHVHVVTFDDIYTFLDQRLHVR